MQNDDFSGEMFAIYFIFLKDAVFLKFCFQCRQAEKFKGGLN